MTVDGNRSWELPSGERITHWRWDQTNLEVLTAAGEWMTFSTGHYVEDDRAWLRIHGVPQLPDRDPIQWVIVTRMPSTGKLTSFQIQSGSQEEYQACRDRWQDTDCVEVYEAGLDHIQKLEEERK